MLEPKRGACLRLFLFRLPNLLFHNSVLVQFPDPLYAGETTQRSVKKEPSPRSEVLGSVNNGRQAAREELKF